MKTRTKERKYFWLAAQQRADEACEEADNARVKDIIDTIYW